MALLPFIYSYSTCMSQYPQEDFAYCRLPWALLLIIQARFPRKCFQLYTHNTDIIVGEKGSLASRKAEGFDFYESCIPKFLQWWVLSGLDGLHVQLFHLHCTTDTMGRAHFSICRINSLVDSPLQPEAHWGRTMQSGDVRSLLSETQDLVSVWCLPW